MRWWRERWPLLAVDFGLAIAVGLAVDAATGLGWLGLLVGCVTVPALDLAAHR